MKTLRVVLLLGLSLNVGGCQVLERAEVCGQLSQLIEGKSRALAPRLAADPSPQALLHKAQLYDELARDMRGLEVLDDRVAKGREGVVMQLEKLARQLERASKAVTLYREEQSQKEPAQNSRNLAEEGARQELVETNQKKSPRPTASAKAGSLSRSESAKGEVLPVDEPQKSDASPEKRSTERAKTQHKEHGQRDYQRARNTAESAGRSLKMALDDLSKTCS